MDIRVRVSVFLDKGEGFEFEDTYGGPAVKTFRAIEIHYVPGEEEVVVYAVQVYKSGKTTANGQPFRKSLDALPEALQQRLSSITVLGVDPAVEEV